MSESTPLIDIESERLMLSAVMVDSNFCFQHIDREQFTADMLVAPRHRKIFTAIREIQDADAPVDFIKLVHKIRETSPPEEAGDACEYIASSMDKGFGLYTGVYLVSRLKTLHRKRMILSRLEQITRRAECGVEDVDALADETMRAMLDLTGDAPVRKTSHIGDIAKRVRDDFDHRMEHGDMRGPGTGFTEVDEMIKGLRGGENYIIAARPAMGKTALALQIAENVALRGTPVAFFSLEMASLQLGDRFIGSRSGVPAKAIRSPRTFCGPEERDKVYQAVDAAADIPLYVVDAVGMGMSAIRGEAKRLHATAGVRAIFIDYIGLIARRQGMSTNDAVGENSRGIKALARELDIPCVTLAQLNRKVETREAKMPMLSDLRDSGEIEQDADAVMMIHRPDYYRQQNDPQAEPDNEAFVGICKHRNGPTGTVKMGFESGRFFNIEANFGRSM